MLGKQIFRIYKLASVFQEMPYDIEMTPYEISKKAGIHHDRILTYIQHAIFYQNFWPRITVTFNGERIRIKKRSPPQAFDLLFHPADAVLIKLFDLGAIDEAVKTSMVQFNDKQVHSLEYLKRLIKFKDDQIGLTPEGVYKALKLMEDFAIIRDSVVANISQVAERLDRPSVAAQPHLFRRILIHFSYNKPGVDET